MAISLPLTSYSPISTSSSSSSISRTSFVPLTSRPRNFISGQNLSRRVLISCSSSNGSNPEPMNGSGLNGQSSFPGMPSFDGTSNPPLKWRRVLLKVSGEALAGDEEQNIDPKVTMAIAREVAAVTRLGIEVIFGKTFPFNFFLLAVIELAV